MKYLILLIVVTSCAAKPSNEMESMTRDVLKAKTGVEIDVKPLPNQK
jgi:hypothetical protein